MKDFKIIDNFLTKEKCEELVSLSEQIGYVEADISYSTGGVINKDIRNNSRLLYRSEELRTYLEELLKNDIPETSLFITNGSFEHKKFLKLSGNFRFYKYSPGEKFKRHRDSNQLEEGGVSLITVLIYLNDVCDGGETFLCDRSLGDNQQLVKPLEGRLLMFDHSIMHSGEELKEGYKYLLRTDLIYEI